MTVLIMKTNRKMTLMFASLLCSLVCHAEHVQGIVISDGASANNATGVNLAADLVDLGENLRTVYIVSEDGKKGTVVKLTSPYGNDLRRGDLIRVDLDNPSISSIEIISRNNDLPIKKKHISELTKDDYYTLVALQGVEFRKKEGGYLNVDERYVQRTSLNDALAQEGLDGFRPAREFVDTWAIMLVDDQGNHIYSLINSTCLWRRNTMGVPKGVGELVGVIVPGVLPRYGSPIGDFAIRPVFESDIMIPKADSTSYRTLCAWNYDFNAYAELDCVNSGKVRFPRQGQIVGDKIRAEIGDGQLWTDTGACITFDKETNARHSYDGRQEYRNTGARSYSALRFDCKSGDWYRSGNEYNGIYVSASLKDISATSLHFNFSFIASVDDSKYAERFPVDWKVSYSIDGSKFIELSDTITLRPSCFINTRHGKKSAVVHTGCAPGFTEHTISLPLELLGKDIIVKLSPCSGRTASLPENFDGSYCDGNIQEDKEAGMIMRLGDISITYIKE